jgi:hypothetical protein
MHQISEAKENMSLFWISFCPKIYKCITFQLTYLHNATCYNHAYEDSGLFCIHASSHPDQVSNSVVIQL